MGTAKPLPPFSPSDIARFRKFLPTTDPNLCWNWNGATVAGYGVFRVANRDVRSHRVAYWLATGDDPGCYLVCHRCDNPGCCNPDHLFLGTSAANQHDCIAKGRKRVANGERAFGCRLTADQVAEIRALYETGNYPQQVIADRYGVSRRTISAIVTGTNWGHVPVLLQRRRRVNQIKA